jgi:hypothetical protein
VRSGFEPRLGDAVLVARLEGDDAPGDVIDRLEDNAALRVSGVGAAELDGAEGLWADIEATAATLVLFPGGSLAASPGRKLRVYAVDVDGQTVVLADSVDFGLPPSASDS